MTFKFELKLNWKFGDPEFPEAIQIQNELFKKKKKWDPKWNLFFHFWKISNIFCSIFTHIYITDYDLLLYHIILITLNFLNLITHEQIVLSYITLINLIILDFIIKSYQFMCDCYYRFGTFWNLNSFFQYYLKF